MSLSRTRAAHLLAALAVLTATGCGATIPGTDGATVSQDGNEVTIETDDGSLKSTATLPEDFPTDEVPLLDGEIINATSLDTATDVGYTVTMRVAGESVSAVAEAAGALVEGAGYTSLGTMNGGEVVITSYENDTWSVGVSVTVSDQDLVASYTVARKQTAETP